MRKFCYSFQNNVKKWFISRYFSKPNFMETLGGGDQQASRKSSLSSQDSHFLTGDAWNRWEKKPVPASECLDNPWSCFSNTCCGLEIFTFAPPLSYLWSSVQCMLNAHLLSPSDYFMQMNNCLPKQFLPGNWIMDDENSCDYWRIAYYAVILLILM